MAIDSINKLNDFIKNNLGEVNENRNTLISIVQVNIELIESLAIAKIQVPEWQYYLNTLINKIITTSFSISELTKGYDFCNLKKDVTVPITDYTSIFILSRALIENYLTLHYIYFNSLPEGEKHFRFLLWEVSGLVTRQQFEPSNEKYKKKMADEKELINKMKKKISEMPEYKILKNSHIQKLEKYGLSRIESWHKLMELSDLNTTMFQSSYSLFSSYAHSEYLSILQLRQTSINSKNPTVLNHVLLCLAFVKIINCLVIKHLTSNFKSAEIVYNTMPENLKSSIEIWAGISKK